MEAWTAHELRERLSEILKGTRPEDRSALVPVLERVADFCRKELAQAEKRLADFSVTGDIDSRALGVLAEVFSRPLRMAMEAAKAKVFVAEHALNHLRASVGGAESG